MKIIVTGASGFVGRHVITRLLERGHSIVAIARNSERAQSMPWFNDVEFIGCDLYCDSLSALQTKEQPDALLHLAWSGLPNYRDYFHIGTNLPADLRFLEAAVQAGIRQLTVAGTCLEYGIQSGPLAETLDTRPTTPYGFAKDSLRRALEFLQNEHRFTLQWVRLFYTYGEGQNPNSLLSQLDQAIDEKAPVFNMSDGNQLRDYLPIQEIAENFALVLENRECNGVINCSSGTPTSVLDVVTRHCERRNSTITLNRGYYPYPDYEPVAFWGIPAKLTSLKKKLN